MPNIRIITPNDAELATITADPAVVATLPVTNLIDVAREAVMRTTGLADQDVKFTWSSSKKASGCALERHNLTSVATWRLRLYSDAAWTTLVYDSGAVLACPPKALGDLEWGIEPLGANLFTGWDHAFSNMWFAVTVYRSGKITLSDAANPDGFMQASRIALGRYLEPRWNFNWGMRLGWIDDSQQSRTEGGTLHTDGVDPHRRMAFKLDWLSASDRPKFQELSRRDGKRKFVYVSAYPESGGALERDHAMVAKLVSVPELEQRHVDDFSGEYVVEEA